MSDGARKSRGIRTARTRRIVSAIAATGVAAAILAAGAQSADAATSILLASAADYAVLGATPDVTNTGPSVITGDLGISPAAALTGFTGAPNGLVIGAQHAADAVALQAQSDLTTAYVQAAGLPAGVVATQLGGTSPVPGVYTDGPGGGGLNLTGTIILDGGGSYDSTWVFQSSSSLIVPGSVTLINGAQACNLFWQVSSSATIGTGSAFAGTVLALTSITAQTGATIDGRLLARNGTVTLDSNVITRPDTCLTGSVGGPGGGTGGGGGDSNGPLGTEVSDTTGLAATGDAPLPLILIAAGLLLAGILANRRAMLTASGEAGGHDRLRSRGMGSRPRRPAPGGDPRA